MTAAAVCTGHRMLNSGEKWSMAFLAGHYRALKRQEPPIRCPACRDCFTVVLFVNDLPAIVGFDQSDSSGGLVVIDNNRHITFIAFI